MSKRVWLCQRSNTVGLTSVLDRVQFLQRDAMLARYMLSSYVHPSVRLSVRLLRASIVPKG